MTNLIFFVIFSKNDKKISNLSCWPIIGPNLYAIAPFIGTREFSFVTKSCAQRSIAISTEAIRAAWLISSQKISQSRTRVGGVEDRCSISYSFNSAWEIVHSGYKVQ